MRQPGNRAHTHRRSASRRRPLPATSRTSRGSLWWKALGVMLISRSRMQSSVLEVLAAVRALAHMSSALADQADDDRDQRQDQEHHEQQLGNARGAGGDAA
eukprot:Opistho-1_new@27630